MSFSSLLKTSVTLTLCLLLASICNARTWTRKDGKTAEGDLLKKSETSVTIALSNKQKIEIPIISLSVDDQQFIKNWKPTPPKRPINVPENAVYHEGSWFAVVLDKTSWKRASQKATQMGGHLVWVKNEETQELVVKLAEGLSLWIGGTDEKVEGLWKWSDGEKIVFKKWYDGEPNNLRGKEHYILTHKSGTWIDVPNDEPTAVGLIVQWD